MEKKKTDSLWLAALDECNEVQRRRLAGVKALEIGRGGVSQVCKLTGMSHHTVLKGIKEVENKSRKPLTRLRKKGGGRKKIIEKYPAIKEKVEKILEENTAGDPMSQLKWTHKSTYTIADEISKTMQSISKNTIATIIKNAGFTLQINKKSLEGKTNPQERDSQFLYINEHLKTFAQKRLPIISVDTKKKELVGKFKNAGARWMKKGHAEAVNIYDFESLAKGKAIPYGIYDLQQNKGFVNIGIDHNTAEFAVESIQQWWKHIGKHNYPKAKKLCICADCGGGNGNKNQLWKYALGKFAHKNNLAITVLHYPPGTSKWNKIEHKMFSFISTNWRGKPLTTYKIIINLLKATKTKTGLKISAQLDKKKYITGKKINPEEFKKIKIKPHQTHPQWNYTIN